MPETQQEIMEALVRKRAGLKGKITNATTFFNNAKSKYEEAEHDVKSALVIETGVRLNKVEITFQQFEEVQDSIEQITDKLDEELTKRDELENAYYKLVANMKQFIQQNDTKDSAAAVEVEASDDETASQGSVATAARLSNQGMGNTIKLPQIKLPSFSGSYETWLEFRDTFRSLIHENEQIGEIQKFHYLRASLQGGAAEVIHALEFSSANYKLAWDSLLERYDNKSLLIQTHVKRLFNLSHIVKESSSELRSFVDQISKNLRSLEILGQPIKEWDTLLVYLVTSKLDTGTIREWEGKKEEAPTLEELKKFLRMKADLLETLEFNKPEMKHKPQQQQRVRAYLNTAANKCLICQQEHQLYNCEKFLKLSPQQRSVEVRKNKLCINCLRAGHFARECKSKFKCRKCSEAHNSLLHFHKDDKQETTELIEEKKGDVNLTSKFVGTTKVEKRANQVLLSTALIQTIDSEGNTQTCRVLLDSGAQSNFIRLDTCEKLGIKKHKIDATVSGISQVSLPIKYKCEVTIRSQFRNYQRKIPFLVLENICDELPNKEVNIERIHLPAYVKLADPTYHVPGKIDMILGASIFWTLLCVGQHEVGVDSLLAQKTVLGWIMTGGSSLQGTGKTMCNFEKTVEIQNQLEKFWKTEEPCVQKTLRKEEQKCEEMFLKTIARNKDGRFVVTIPLKHNPEKLGDSEKTARQRFSAIEKKLDKNARLKSMYTKFMQEYESLGHMSKISPEENKRYNYLPHHGVINEASSTTKLRVVFDGSAKTESGWSFNDLQFVGPTTQDDLWSIMLRFRQHTYVICADVEKMYRQVLINPDQRNLQCILWRTNEAEEINTYQLNTVTYGTSSAPYLATRCLSQLAVENQEQFPKAAAVIKSDFYVDDLLTGSNTLEELEITIRDVMSICKSAGFELKKFVSNSQQLLQNLQQDIPLEVLSFRKNEQTKTLGVYWSSYSDEFMFHINEVQQKRITKRTILAEIAQIFDPLGLLSPCIVQAKILLQGLWMLKLSWDEAVPQHIHSRWTQFRQQLTQLNYVTVPRHIMTENTIAVELHAFADASQDAYGACVYVRSITQEGEVRVRLLTAKSKVAPLKVLTIPRLELCAAVVLAQLVQKINVSLTLKPDSFYYWSDSTIVLHWLHTQSKQLQPFVGYRVSQIQEKTLIKDWNHIPTADNPADLLSRGLKPEELSKNSLWWHGPSWLFRPKNEWPAATLKFEGEPPEVKKNVNLLVSSTTSRFQVEKFSNYAYLKRVMAYCLRFVNNCQKKGSHNQTVCLTTEELNEATIVLVKLCQSEFFSEEIKLLKTHKELSAKCYLKKLNPFLDSRGILRVGGRIQLLQATFDKKHPALLPKNHHLTHLIIKQYHEDLFHAGAQATLAAVRENFWPIAGRSLVRKITRSCVSCFKVNPETQDPIMGILPKSRVTPAPPFENSGVDYAGPIMMKNRVGRGSQTIKGYICLFVCMCTKAVHVELVSSMTTEAFIAALRRFSARRGKPKNIYSDNGRNFVKANKELAALLKTANLEIQGVLANKGTNWHFIPPYAPHFGGLWEAGIKSVKYHLKRVLGNKLLTYENLNTVLIQIEAILNSRPLIPLSTDPCDYQALTPGHFLIGKPLTTVPDPDTRHIPQNRLSKFQEIQQIQQHFWNRWSKEYLSELQVRLKWKKRVTPLEEGTLVIMKEDHTPPLQWHLGRVIQVYNGPDGIPRVAEIRTAEGITKRAVHRLCPVPINEQCCDV